MKFKFVSILFLVVFFFLIFPFNLSQRDEMEEGDFFVESEEIITEEILEVDVEEFNSLPDNLDATSSEEILIEEDKEELIAEEGETEEEKNIILLSVPFAAQAPFGDWDDARQQDGCEEASALMAVSWVRGVESITKTKALEEVIAISEYELEKYDNFNDTSASSTIKIILEEYFDYYDSELFYDFGIADIITELEKGNLVMAPFDGRVLNNIYYTPPGPDRHMLVIIGYDYETEEFITNDPGTRHGEGYRYDKDVLFSAIRDYPSGHHLPIFLDRKAMIVIRKN